jgi:hypothetical protein
MDPNATLQSLHDAMDNAEWQEAIEHADNLIAWLTRGGFVPGALGTVKGGPVAYVRSLRLAAQHEIASVQS